MPLLDGSHLWLHAGQNAPPATAGWRWRLERDGTRRFEGRDVDVFRYVPEPLDAATAGAPPPAYAQADFVDPRTGEVVGGLDGWGHERFPSEAAEPLPCPGR